MVRTEPKQRLSGSNVQSQSEAAVVLLQPPVLPQVCLGPVVISEQGQQVRLSPTRKNAPQELCNALEDWSQVFLFGLNE